MAIHVPFKFYHSVTDQSCYLSPSPGNVRIGSMASDKCFCLVAIPSPDRIIIMSSSYGSEYCVEECAVV